MWCNFPGDVCLNVAFPNYILVLPYHPVHFAIHGNLRTSVCVCRVGVVGFRWGYGETCALGHGSDKDYTLPTKVDTEKRGIVKVSHLHSFWILLLYSSKIKYLIECWAYLSKCWAWFTKRVSSSPRPLFFCPLPRRDILWTYVTRSPLLNPGL